MIKKVGSVGFRTNSSTLQSVFDRLMRTRQEFFSVADVESIASWPFASRLGGFLAAAADVKSSSHTEGRCCAKPCASVPYWHPRVVMDLIQVSESEVEVGGLSGDLFPDLASSAI